MLREVGGVGLREGLARDGMPAIVCVLGRGCV